MFTGLLLSETSQSEGVFAAQTIYWILFTSQTYQYIGIPSLS